MQEIIRLPEIIDIHVHFRDPQETAKEDFYTGTLSAIAGGVTCVFDMPNNLKPILSYQRLEEKRQIAQKKAVCDWGLYFGTDGKNISEFKKVVGKVVGLKVYLGVTTGRLFIEEENLLENVFRAWPKEKVIVIHTEEDKIDLAIHLAKKYGNKIHITHVNTKALLKKIIKAKKEKLKITCDVTPHHLFLEKKLLHLRKEEKKKQLERGFYEVKPPLAEREDIDFLWQNLDEIDCIVSDHAPHQIKEKKGKTPPPGMPGLETMLPLLLTAVKQGKMTKEDIVRLTNLNPQKIFGLKREKDNYIEVDMSEKFIIENKNLKTKCSWSPFVGWEVWGKVKNVYLRGKKIFANNRLLVQPGFGRDVLF